MKHLKRFDEELNPSTYRKAGNKLINKFKEKRGGTLVDYGNEKEFGFYNMYFANSNTIIGRINEDFIFTKPQANFYFQSIYEDSFDGNGNLVLRNNNAEDLVKSWKEGDELCFTISFSFFATEKTKQISEHSSLRSWKGVPMFSFRVYLSDYSDGIVEWNTNQDTGEVLIGTEDEQDTYEMFVNSFYTSIYLEKPASEYNFGIFKDRASAFKFKKALPKLIEPFEDQIHDIISAIGGDSEHFEKIMDIFNKISLNGLYDDDVVTIHKDYSKRWFNSNQIS